MAYYNGFPVTYPYYQQPQQTQQNGSPIWIQGEAAAKSYLVAPNSTVVLFEVVCHFNRIVLNGCIEIREHQNKDKVQYDVQPVG